MFQYVPGSWCAPRYQARPRGIRRGPLHDCLRRRYTVAGPFPRLCRGQPLAARRRSHHTSVLLQQACMFPAGTPVKQLAIVCDMAAQLLLGKHACTRTPPKVMAGGCLTLCSTTYWRYARLPMSTPDSLSQPSCDLVSHHMALSLHHLLLPGLVLGLGLGGSIPLWCRQPPGYSLPCVGLILSDSPSQHRSKLDPAQTT
jgi:hypothetical protein